MNKFTKSKIQELDKIQKRFANRRGRSGAILLIALLASQATLIFLFKKNIVPLPEYQILYYYKSVVSG